MAAVKTCTKRTSNDFCFRIISFKIIKIITWILLRKSCDKQQSVQSEWRTEFSCEIETNRNKNQVTRPTRSLMDKCKQHFSTSKSRLLFKVRGRLYGENLSLISGTPSYPNVHMRETVKWNDLGTLIRMAKNCPFYPEKLSPYKAAA